MLACCTLVGIGGGVLFGHLDRTPTTTVDPSEARVIEMDLPLFHSIAFRLLGDSNQPVKVTIRAGDRQSVAIVANQSGQGAVRTRVSNGVLNILLDRKTDEEGPLRINLASPRLRKIVMDGVGIVEVTGGIRSASLHLEAIRGGQITARRLGTRQLIVSASRGGRVQVGGSTAMLRAHATAGVIQAADLNADVAQVSCVERSRIEVQAFERLDAFARREGHIFLQRTPQQILRDLDRSSTLNVM